MTDINPLRLAKLQQSRAIVDESGRPVADFVRYLNDNVTNLQTIVNAIGEQVTAITEALEAADIAIAAAEAAQAAADNANDAAEASASASSLANSYTSAPGLILSSAADGPTATITIAAHDRVYADGTTVPVDAGVLTGLAYATVYFIYYNDPSRAGGSVTYLSSTDYLDAAQLGDIHSVGSIETPPSSSDPPTQSGGTRPPGYSGRYDIP